MAGDETDRTRNARVQTLDDPGTWQKPSGQAYRCQVFLYSREDGVYLAVAAALPGVAGVGATEAEALADITRAFKRIIPMYTRDGGKIPWLDTPVGPEPGGTVRWLFPEV